MPETVARNGRKGSETDDRSEGQAKEAEGKLTGDQAEGKAQDALGQAKAAAEGAADAAHAKLGDLKN